MMEAGTRVIPMGMMISSNDICEGGADKICWWETAERQEIKDEFMLLGFNRWEVIETG